MRKKIFLLILSATILGLITHLYTSAAANESLVSPESINGKLAANLWLPEVKKSYAQEQAPEVTAKAAYFVDTDTGKVLYAKNIAQQLPVASLVKIMTAIVTLEHRQWQDVLTVSEGAAAMEPDKMLLIAGEKLTVEELLDGVFLVSANDASEVLAEQVTGNRDEFISLMNEKALFLGMKNSSFINPSGLDEDDQQQYSTAFDVALMSRYAIKHFPRLMAISSSEHIYLPETEDHQFYDMYSGINLLTTYPGVVGFKTGYTPKAGLTLVTLAQKDGSQVLGVLLDSVNRREEAKILLDYSFQQL